MKLEKSVTFIKNGDILKAEKGFICHGVNCQGVMGAGLAKKIADKYPDVYKTYKNYAVYPNANLLGKVVWAQPNIGNLWVANCFTQVFYGNHPPVTGQRIHLNYQALEKCLLEVFYASAGFHNYPIHLPKIGCGLAGGDWNFVKDMIYDKVSMYPKIPVFIYI